MPSFLHDALVDLIRDHPDLLVRLGALVGPIDALRVVDPVVTKLAPAELRADLAIMAGEPAAFGLLIEVQLQVDHGKRYQWPSYATSLAARWRCPAGVVVLTPDDAVARWPDEIPVVSDPGLAMLSPELALLSALAHGERAAGLSVLSVLAQVICELPTDRARGYHDVVLARLSPARRTYLEEAMRDYKGYEPASDWAKEHWHAGRAEGKAEGKAEGAAHLILRQLVRRVGMLGEAQQARVRALPLDLLEALGEALLDFTGPADLDAWLAANETA